ncbi:MAG: insulinase family protein [Clostridium sp.]|nr:insulinase family protein [Clostridium sp.]
MPDRKTPPRTGSIEQIILAPATLLTLDNGTEITIVNQPEFDEINRVTILAGGGAADAPSNAVATLSTATLSEGTTTRSGKEIADSLEEAGSWLKNASADTSRFVTLYSLNSEFDRTMDLFCDIFANPSFPEEAVERAKTRLASQTEIEMTKVSVIASRRATSLLLAPDNPRARFNTPGLIRSVTREQLEAFHYANCSPCRMKIFVAGNITDRVLGILTDNLSRLPAGVQAVAEPYRRFGFAESSESIREDIAVEGARQTAVNIAIPTVGVNHPDFIPLTYTTMALGGYFGSRLMKNIREEKGLTYGISAVTTGMHENGVIRITAECDRANVDRLIEETFREIDRLAVEPPRGEELARLRSNIVSGLASVVDSPFSQIIHRISRAIEQQSDDYFERQVEAALRLDSDMISQIAERHLVDARRVTVTAG